MACTPIDRRFRSKIPTLSGLGRKDPDSRGTGSRRVRAETSAGHHRSVESGRPVPFQLTCCDKAPCGWHSPNRQTWSFSRWLRLAGTALALPHVLAAGARHRLRGMFLCQRLPTDGTIFAPHLGSAFLNKPVARWRARQADRSWRRILPAAVALRGARALSRRLLSLRLACETPENP